MTTIEWTQRPGTKGETWNPVAGCTILSPGCTHCYAMKMAARIEAINAAAGRDTHYAGTTKPSKAGPVWTGAVNIAPDHIFTAPLRWKSPRTVFVNSMSDLFHEDVPDETIDRVFAIMALTPQHTYQILTKRSARMRAYLSAARAHPVALEALELTLFEHVQNPKSKVGAGCIVKGDFPHLAVWPLPNVWLGVSAERQQEADERVPDLLATPAAIRFVSAEPLLEEIDFRNFLYVGAEGGVEYSYTPRNLLHQIIVGGESGPGARPMHPAWARRIREDCAAAGTAFFFKQWGAYLPVGQHLPGHGKVHGATAVKPGRMKLHYGGTPTQAPQHAFADSGVEFASTADGLLAFHLGKSRAGRMLDGVEHSEWPTPHAPHPEPVEGRTP